MARFPSFNTVMCNWCGLFSLKLAHSGSYFKMPIRFPHKNAALCSLVEISIFFFIFKYIHHLELIFICGMEWKSNSLLWAALISCCSLFILFPVINFCLFTYFINSYFLFYVGTFNCRKPCVPAWAPTCLLCYCTSFKWYPRTFWSETWLNSSGVSLIGLIPEGLGQGCFLHVPYGHLDAWGHYGSIQPWAFTGQGIWAASLV